MAKNIQNNIAFNNTQAKQNFTTTYKTKIVGTHRARAGKKIKMLEVRKGKSISLIRCVKGRKEQNLHVFLSKILL